MIYIYRHIWFKYTYIYTYRYSFYVNNNVAQTGKVKISMILCIESKIKTQNFFLDYRLELKLIKMKHWQIVSYVNEVNHKDV